MSAPLPGRDGAHLLDVRDLTVAYRRGRAELTAVDGLSFAVSAGRTLGIIGESGSGKSSAARAVMQLEPVRAGSVHFRGRDLVGMRGRALRSARRDMQMVFQDPFGSFNPKVPVGESVVEPLLVHHIGDARSRRDRVAELVSAVGLSP
ncbi:MAG TPA: ATP-binding cassette domain-containing protein, partial [Rugosimonospora sp.]|nr:ATP-binding cassette domain-containing protein [Rugosimonospora sp.]